MPFQQEVEETDQWLEAVIDLNEEDKSVNIQLRIGLDNPSYPTLIHLDNITKVRTRGGNSVDFTSKDGTSVYISPGSLYVSNSH